MRISFNALHQNWQGARPARQFVQEEMEVMVLCEELGIDIVMPPEHHFDQHYSACPDNFLTLSYLAAKTSTMLIGLGAIILPWNDPLRVVEKISVLDHLSEGRLRIGFGRGLARMEYERFGIEMDSSRQRFDEAFAIVTNALRTGVIEADTEYYQQPKAEIVPIPRPDIADAFYMVGMSPDSAKIAGQHGAQLLTFVTKPLDDFMPLVQDYFDAFEEAHPGQTPPNVQTTDFVYVHEDEEIAQKGADEYVGNYFHSVVRHYDFDGTHFKDTKGYEAYAEGAQAIRDAGMELATQGYVGAQAGVGTPEQIIAKYRQRMEVMGPIDPGGCLFYGGMTVEDGRRNARLFAEAVMPELRKMEQEFIDKRDAKKRETAAV